MRRIIQKAPSFLFYDVIAGFRSEILDQFQVGARCRSQVQVRSTLRHISQTDEKSLHLVCRDKRGRVSQSSLTFGASIHPKFKSQPFQKIFAHIKIRFCGPFIDFSQIRVRFEGEFNEDIERSDIWRLPFE